MKNKLLSIAIIALLSLTSCEGKKSYTAEENAIKTASYLDDKKQESNLNKVEFHLEVRGCPYSKDHYSIFFTNDNWETEEVILKVYFGSIQEEGFNNMAEATLNARELNTYKKCVSRNKEQLRISQKSTSSTKIKIY